MTISTILYALFAGVIIGIIYGLVIGGYYFLKQILPIVILGIKQKRMKKTYTFRVTTPEQKRVVRELMKLQNAKK